MSARNVNGDSDKSPFVPPDLLKKAIEGDKKAVSDLCKKCRPRVLFWCKEFLNHHQDAEDVTQATVLQVALNIHALKQPGSFKSWLYQVTRNVCIDHCNKAKRQADHVRLDQEEGSSPVRELIDPGATPEQIVVSEAEIEAMYQILTPKERQVVEERMKTDKTFEEIAGELKAKPATLRQLYQRGISRLQNFFNKKRPST